MGSPLETGPASERTAGPFLLVQCGPLQARQRLAIFPPMAWRIKPPVKRPGMIEPCIPTRASEPPVGPQWIHGIKHHGYRLIARKRDGWVRLFLISPHQRGRGSPGDGILDDRRRGRVVRRRRPRSRGRQAVSRGNHWLRGPLANNPDGDAPSPPAPLSRLEAPLDAEFFRFDGLRSGARQSTGARDGGRARHS
jgi:hypothetical protein